MSHESAFHPDQDRDFTTNSMDHADLIPKTPDEFFIAVLSHWHLPLTKQYYLEDDKVKAIPYANGRRYQTTRVEVRSLLDLFTLLQEVAPHPFKCLVRGVPAQDDMSARRTNGNFPEPVNGTHWVMLDIDKHELPPGLDPLGREAIEVLIGKLPPPFQQASYIYQHSGSAGIIHPDGTPLKPGLNVHLFFYLDRPVLTSQLKAYLQQYCIETGFYSFDIRNALTMRYGLDMATVSASSQPHYVANPIIREGVQCKLTTEQRMGMVLKDSNTVTVPELTKSLAAEVKTTSGKLRQAEAQKLGLKSRTCQTRTNQGISSQRYYEIPKQTQSALRLGRQFISAELTDDGQYAILCFEDEATPRSWFVAKHSPTIARRYGDLASVPLRELAPEAYSHVQENLKWFQEINAPLLSLQIDGFLPPLNSFMKARFSLVVAPTGTGKTKAVIDWLEPLIGSDMIVVYVAPRIALVQQMAADLKSKTIQHHVYTNLHRDSELLDGVVLTTCHSMGRILEMVYRTGKHHVLIMDEIHIVLDEAMKTKHSLERFEKAIVAADRSVFLTGTLTDLQRRALSQTVIHAAPALAKQDYTCYEFAPVQTYPLHLLESKRFETDVDALLGELKQLRAEGKTIPRVVVIQDRSKLDFFRQLLRVHGLEDIADVISRKESLDEEILQTIPSTRPLLITTSLFAVGLNFIHPPVRLWCCFDLIKADTNAIIQTINRANRTETTAEVRIYHQDIDTRPLRLPKDMKDQVRIGLEAESTLPGILEEYQHVDRVTYQSLRKIERNTAAALGQLLENDGFQNYQVQHLLGNYPTPDKNTKEKVKELQKDARKNYSDLIEAAAAAVRKVSEHREYFDRLEELRVERKETRWTKAGRTDLAIDNDAIGSLMRLCDEGKSAHGKNMVEGKLAVLFGERFPWISDQYDPERHSDHGKVMAEKLSGVIRVLEFLERLRGGKLTPADLVNAFSRNQGLRQGLLMLERSDVAYQEAFRAIDSAKTELTTARNGTAQQREEAKQKVLKLLHTLIKPLGCHFEVERGIDGVQRTNYNKAVVPQTWDFSAMVKNLEGHIERFLALKPGIGTLSLWSEDQKTGEEARTLELCSGCVFRWRNYCTKGHPTGWRMGDFWTGEAECGGFVALSASRHPEVSSAIFEKLAERTQT